MRILQVIHGYPPRYNAGSEVYTQTLAHGWILGLTRAYRSARSVMSKSAKNASGAPAAIRSTSTSPSCCRLAQPPLPPRCVSTSFRSGFGNRSSGVHRVPFLMWSLCALGEKTSVGRLDARALESPRLRVERAALLRERLHRRARDHDEGARASSGRSCATWDRARDRDSGRAAHPIARGRAGR